MAVENWIDEICKLWEIDDGRGGTVRSYRVFERQEFPAAITQVPCAITYTTEVTSQYSLGGPLIDMWQGQTEFHLTLDIDKSYYPELMRFFAKIRNAAAGSMTLSSKVDHFLLRVDEGPSIQGPITLQYGSEEPHLGIIVYWEVKENVSGDYTPAQ